MSDKSPVRTAASAGSRTVPQANRSVREAPKMRVVTKGWWTLREGRETAEKLAKSESGK